MKDILIVGMVFDIILFLVTIVSIAISFYTIITSDDYEPIGVATVLGSITFVLWTICAGVSHSCDILILWG